MSDSLWPSGLRHDSLPCPSLSPRVFSNSCPLSQWCHPTISSFVAPFSSCPQSFPTSGFFPMTWFFVSGGQSIRASDSASVLTMIIQGWFPLGLTGLISLLSKGPTFGGGETDSPWVYWVRWMVAPKNYSRTPFSVILIFAQLLCPIL